MKIGEIWERKDKTSCSRYDWNNNLIFVQITAICDKKVDFIFIKNGNSMSDRTIEQFLKEFKKVYNENR